jgi:hypothetical protein
LFHEHFGEEFVQAFEQGIAAAEGGDRPIGVGAIFVGIEVRVELIPRHIHAAMPEHRSHTGFSKFHIHPIVPKVMKPAGELAFELALVNKFAQFRMAIPRPAPDPQIGMIARVMIFPIEIFLRDEIFEKWQWFEKYLFADVEQIAPIEIHRHSIGFVDADDLHQVFGAVGEHGTPGFEPMNDVGEGMGGRWQLGLGGGLGHGFRVGLNGCRLGAATRNPTSRGMWVLGFTSLHPTYGSTDQQSINTRSNDRGGFEELCCNIGTSGVSIGDNGISSGFAPLH